MSVIFSCKDCVPPERHVGCHSTCEKYLTEKAENDRIREEENKRKTSQVSLNSNGTYFRGKGYRKKKH